jgi:hypothetical protein
MLPQPLVGFVHPPPPEKGRALRRASAIRSGHTTTGSAPLEPDPPSGEHGQPDLVAPPPDPVHGEEGRWDPPPVAEKDHRGGGARPGPLAQKPREVRERRE